MGDKEAAAQIFKEIKDVLEDKDKIFECIKILKLKLLNTNCKRCLRDYYSIIKDELNK